MKSLSDLNLIAVMDTSEHNLTSELFVPLLSNSIRYDRGVGYFSSGWLRTNYEGMAAFADNGGKARWITSPILDQADWDALQAGNAARNDIALRAILQQNITNLAEVLKKDTLSALA
jgi:hypothetical protein